MHTLPTENVPLVMWDKCYNSLALGTVYRQQLVKHVKSHYKYPSTLCDWTVLLQCPHTTAMGYHTTVSVVLLILTASVWMAAGVTQTCPVLPGVPGRDGRDAPLVHLVLPASQVNQ